MASQYNARARVCRLLLSRLCRLSPPPLEPPPSLSSIRCDEVNSHSAGIGPLVDHPTVLSRQAQASLLISVADQTTRARCRSETVAGTRSTSTNGNRRQLTDSCMDRHPALQCLTTATAPPPTSSPLLDLLDSVLEPTPIYLHIAKNIYTRRCAWIGRSVAYVQFVCSCIYAKKITINCKSGKRNASVSCLSNSMLVCLSVCLSRRSGPHT